MKTIAFYNNKGGVGKTTLAANIGYNLSTMGYRVLLVDCDPQGNLSSFFGRYDLTKKGLMQALGGQLRCIYRTAYKGLDILPGNIYSEALTPQPQTMSALLQGYAAHYDYCILDCAPAFSRLTESAVQASDQVIIPIKLDNFSIEGIDTTMSKLVDPSAAHVVINAFAPSRAAKDFLTKLVQTYDYPLCETLVRYSTVVDAANYRKKPLAKKAKFHWVTADMMDLTEEVCGYGIAN